MSSDNENTCLLHLRVVPNASHDEITGVLPDGRWKIKVRAVPERGRANRAVVEFLAKALDLSKRAVTIETGETSREKTVKIAGLSIAETTKRLNTI